MLNNKALDAFFDEVFEEISCYSDKYQCGNYEIAVLVSRVGYDLLREWHPYEKQLSFNTPLDADRRLFGHRVIFGDSDVISLEKDDRKVIKPVIVPKFQGLFPESTAEGDIVMYNDCLKEVVGIEFAEENEVINIRDIPILYSEIPFAIDQPSPWFLKKIESEILLKNAWCDSTDTSAITDYFNSISII